MCGSVAWNSLVWPMAENNQVSGGLCVKPELASTDQGAHISVRTPEWRGQHFTGRLGTRTA